MGFASSGYIFNAEIAIIFSNTKLIYFRPFLFSFLCAALGIVKVIKRYFNTLAPTTTTCWLHPRPYKKTHYFYVYFFASKLLIYASAGRSEGVSAIIVFLVN